MKKYLISAMVIATCMAAAGSIQAQDATGKGYARVNGIKMYYEISGTGEPLLLLHGGLGSMGMFERIMPAINAGRQVIAVDLYGHGRTALTDRPVSYIDMADDLAALLRQLGIKQVDVLGYSMGGIAGLRLAIQHPGLVRRLALVSTVFARDGFYPDILAQQEQMNAGAAALLKQTPIYKSYAAIAPQPEDFPKLLEQMGQMMKRPFDWSAEVARLEMPVMLVYGDGDMIRPAHIVKFYELLGGGKKDAGWNRENMPQNRLAILPNHTHYDMLMAPELPQTVRPFLDGKMQARPELEH
ncbi:alpha/beta fold hydrolase [Chitinophaga japonensis]|uniref:Pimeloyl-ACP methyl ester carboxylesterase n=1 Tax=Chitinophaga japonensis TaxID=104662 RepID=A0A562SZY7_CHIJA|nr:alpha/beta hydrolase [Chitinophaga japonensis]TWI86396.1 pimeloyl-ACP methyl ester carboxylesterase [Chitinophaga japonensis]